MSSKFRTGKYDETDLIHYKLETLEKRLDHIENLVHTKLGNQSQQGSTELVHLLMDMLRQQTGMQAPAAAKRDASPSASHANKDNQAAAASAQEDPAASFDTASCMARRRTII